MPKPRLTKVAVNVLSYLRGHHSATLPELVIETSHDWDAIAGAVVGLERLGMVECVGMGPRPLKGGCQPRVYRYVPANPPPLPRGRVVKPRVSCHKSGAIKAMVSA